MPERGPHLSKPPGTFAPDKLISRRARPTWSKSIGPTDRQERLAIKRVLNALAFGDMLQAVSRCEELMKLRSPEDFKKPTSALTASQDQIIDVLRKLLDVTRHAQAEVLAEMKKRPDSKLPDDVKQKLEEMRGKLDKLLAQQKKVIEATENLAKVPVEDFTKKEEEALKGMAAAEDNFAKFMKEMHSDLSKVPEQDFANSSMAKESVEVQTELKMAEDALLAKSAEAAVPLEQLGAEMAEEIKTNIEKWLAEKPDRHEMEPGGAADGQVQGGPDGRVARRAGRHDRRVGRQGRGHVRRDGRREQQLDRFARQGRGLGRRGRPHLDHVGQGDHGQPDAQCTTRSAAGRARAGKASRAASSSATRRWARAGARRPAGSRPIRSSKARSRTTAKSRPAGPPAAARRAARAARGSKAPPTAAPANAAPSGWPANRPPCAIRAEGIELQFQVTHFHHTDLKKMIDVMAQIERDLKAGRYQNALRQRQVLANGLGNVKQYLEGEFQVRQDATANLPTDIQKEILGSMQDPSPAGWEDLNRQYFERLSGSARSRRR